MIQNIQASKTFPHLSLYLFWWGKINILLHTLSLKESRIHVCIPNSLYPIGHNYQSTPPNSERVCRKLLYILISTIHKSSLNIFSFIPYHPSSWYAKLFFILDFFIWANVIKLKFSSLCFHARLFTMFRDKNKTDFLNSLPVNSDQIHTKQFAFYSLNIETVVVIARQFSTSTHDGS